MTFAHKHDQATASTRDGDWKLSIDYATNNYSILPLNCLLIRLVYSTYTVAHESHFEL